MAAVPITAVQELPHPQGEEGVITSLRRVVAKVRAARNHPTVISWVGNVLHAAGDPKGHVARARAIYEAMQKQNVWMPDPRNVERMAGAHLTLGDGKTPPPFRGGDCDDLVIGCLGACECAGIPTYVVGASYKDDRIISHVLGMVNDGKGTLYYLDPSSRFPFGTAQTPTREYVIDVQTEKVLCDDRSCSINLKGQPPPTETRPGYYLSLDGLGTLGDVPSVYPADGSQPIRESDVVGVNERAYLEGIVQRLDLAWDDFKRIYSAAQTSLGDLGLPVLGSTENKMFGPESLQRAVDLQEMVKVARAGIVDVIEGRRKIWLEDGFFGADLAIQQLPTDPVRVGLDLKNNLPYLYQGETGGVTHGSGQIGLWPAIAAGAAVVTIVVALAVAASARAEAEKARAAADIELIRKEAELIKAGKTEELVRVYQARAKVQQASTPKGLIEQTGQAAKDTGEGLWTAAKGFALGGLVVGGLYMLFTSRKKAA